ncbi:MAG: hypothetical protein AAFM92_09065 [Pseudomonadota bacterium]
MHPADEYARLKALIRSLELRAGELREDFLAGRAPRRSEDVQVLVQLSERKVFLKDRLPRTILDDPRYWEARRAEIVRVRPLVAPPAADAQVPEEDAMDVLDTW